jgi:hypothetical protein
MSIRYVYYKSDGTSQTRREIVEELDQENHLTAATAIWDRLVAFYNGYLDPATPLKYRIQRIYVGSAGAARDLYFHYDLSPQSHKLMEQLLKFNTSAVVHLLPKSHFYQQLLDHMGRNTISVDSIDPTTQEPIYPILFDNGHQLHWEETPSGLGVTETAYGPESNLVDPVRPNGPGKKNNKKVFGILAAIVGVIALGAAFQG